MARADRLDPVEYRALIIRKQRERLRRRKETTLDLLVAMVPQIITEDAIKAAAEGASLDEIGRKLQRPPLRPIQSHLTATAQDGWTAGLLEAEMVLEGIRSPDIDAVVRRVLENEPREFDQFDDIDAARLASVRARRRQRARHSLDAQMPPEQVRISPKEDRLIQLEARRVARSFRRIMEDQIREGEAAEAMEVDRQIRRAERLKALRNTSDPETLALLRQIQLEDREATAAVAEVDWQVNQRGIFERTRVDAVVAGYEWVSRRDLVVTCVCQLFDGGLIWKGDPLVEEVRPQIHYRCRCSLYPRSVTDRKEFTWRKRERFVVGEPTAADTKRALSVARSQVVVPAASPNVPPPKRCQEWIARGIVQLPEQPSQNQLERDYIQQRARLDDRQLKRILNDPNLESRLRRAGLL